MKTGCLFAAVVLLAASSAFAHDLPEKLVRSVCRIHIFDKDGTSEGCGSGVAYDKRHLVTARHVAINASNGGSIKVEEYDEDGDLKEALDAKVLVIGKQDEDDCAILEVDKDLDCFTELHPAKLHLGSTIFAIGAAYANFGFNPFTITEGHYMAKHASGAPNMSQSSNDGIGGMSGGGCFDEKGDFVGIAIACMQKDALLFLPAETVMKYIEKAKKHE